MPKPGLLYSHHNMDRACVQCAHLHHPAQSFIRAFSLHWNILLYPMILFAESECPDQTVRMRRLIWAFAVRICPNTCFPMARPMYMYMYYWVVCYSQFWCGVCWSLLSFQSFGYHVWFIIVIILIVIIIFVPRKKKKKKKEEEEEERYESHWQKHYLPKCSPSRDSDQSAC